MVIIKFTINVQAKTFDFAAEGHADYSRDGKDLVCAAVTTLAYTLAQNIVDSQKRLAEKRIDLKKGQSTVFCRCKTKEDFVRVLQIFSVIRTGYILLSNNFPQNVSVICDVKDR